MAGSPNKEKQMAESKNNKEDKDKVESGQSHPNSTSNEVPTIRREKQCRSCCQSIHIAARVCQHCGQAQGFWRRHFGDIAVIVSIVMVIIAATQLVGAFKINVDASKALNTAKNAAMNADLALTQAQSDANEIQSVRSQADKFISLLEKSSKLTSEIVELQKISALINEFMMTVVSAQNDDRQAYDQLSALENDNQSPFQQAALMARVNIRLQYGERLGSRGGISSIAPSWKEGVDPSSLTISQLIDDYNGTSWHFHSGLIAYIWERDDFSKGERVQFLVDVLTNERNLKAVCIAQYLLSKEANIKFNPLVIEALLEWWEENKGYYDKNAED